MVCISPIIGYIAVNIVFFYAFNLLLWLIMSVLKVRAGCIAVILGFVILAFYQFKRLYKVHQDYKVARNDNNLPLNPNEVITDKAL
jgi:O-antigen ligase